MLKNTKLLIFGSLFLGIFPAALLFSEYPLLEFLIALNFIAWALVAAFLFDEEKQNNEIQKKLGEIGIKAENEPFNKILDSLQTELKASHALVLSKNRSSRLEESLAKTASLAYELLKPQALELSLYDRESELWSQNIMLGSSKFSELQSFLSEGTVSEHIVEKEIFFSGTKFGTLKVEFQEGRAITEGDRRIIALLSHQAAIVLLDSQFTNELLRMREKSDESIKAKTGFLANLSHEIRGPLGIILNAVELILYEICGAITDDQRESLTMIKESGDHLLDLVNDVLDYAKVEAGKILVNSQTIQLEPFLKDLVSVVRSQAVAKGHKLTLKDVPSDIAIVADKRHARQMLINFLTNAVKYTPEGGEVTVSAEKVSAKRMKIIVSDSGVGIPESERHKVFGAFERVNLQYSMAQVGTGLGMPLTKRLAEANGGIVDFDSEVGKGSRFWLIIPALFGVETSAETEMTKSEGAAGSGETVLLIDDDSMHRKLLDKFLTEEKFNVILASSGREILDALRNNKVQLAIIDNDSNQEAGEEVIQNLRSTPQGQNIPLVMLTSQAFVFDIEHFLKLGVDRCFTKPAELKEVASTIKRLISESH